MPVAFGFSVGDFIASINFLIGSIKSLDDTQGAKADYQGLLKELQGLENALDGIQKLSPDPAQATQIAAVNTSIGDCRFCIDGFLQRNNKFQTLKSTNQKRWSLQSFRKNVRGVQWALWKKEDVATLRAQL